jgi:hypothetical protein
MGLKESELKGRVPRNATDEIRVEKGKYWNLEVVDIRWYKDGSPTSKGVRVNMKELTHLSNILRRIVDGEHQGSRETNQEDE